MIVEDEDSVLVHVSSAHTNGDAWDTNDHEHHKAIETYHTEETV